MLVRMAKCCTPVPGDEIVGYISVGRGITVHREDCPNVRALRRNPERFTEVHWDVDSPATTSFRVTIALQSWDRPRLLEDVARTFAEYGCNIVEYGGHVADQMARNWYTVEVGDMKTLRVADLGAEEPRGGLRRLPGDARRLVDSPPWICSKAKRALAGQPELEVAAAVLHQWTLISLIPLVLWCLWNALRATRRAASCYLTVLALWRRSWAAGSGGRPPATA